MTTLENYFIGIEDNHVIISDFVQSVWDTLYSRISAGVLDFSFRCLETCIQGQSCNLGIYENGLKKEMIRKRGRILETDGDRRNTRSDYKPSTV